MKIQDLMTAEVRTCRPSDTLSQAAQVMWESDLGCLPVVDEDARLIGMVTDRDLAMAAHFRGAPLWAVSVADAMAKTVYTCGPGDKLRQAARLMSQHQLRRLPVVDRDGRLIGMVGISSLAHAATGKAKKKTPVSGKDVCAILSAITAPRVPQLSETIVVEVTRDDGLGSEPEVVEAVLKPASRKPRKNPAKKRKQRATAAR